MFLFCVFLRGLLVRFNAFSLVNHMPSDPSRPKALMVNELWAFKSGHTLSGPCNLHVIGASTLRSARDAGEIPAPSKVAN